MSDDLHALLARAATEIEGSAPALDGGRLSWVHAAARRRRIARRTAESFAGVGAVGVVGAALWFGLGQQPPEPVVPVETPTVSPTPTPSPSPTQTPTPSASPTPTGPPTRAESIDDATVIARLSAPRTGESWQTPTAAPQMAPVLLGDGSDQQVFLVGARADAAIYMTVLPDFYGQGAAVDGLYEVDAAGPRLIACPSARTGDPCTQQQLLADGVERDEMTFYDTFTLPSSILLGAGHVLTTTQTQADQAFPYHRYGFADALAGAEVGEQRVLRRLGPLTLVVESFASDVPGLTNIRYGLVTPFRAVVSLVAADAPGGDFDAIRWEEGHEPTRPGDGSPLVARSPGEGACLPRTFAEEAEHVDAEWQRAGTTPDGRGVYLPVDGGNAMSRAVRAWQEEISWTMSDAADDVVEGAAAGYAFPTDEGFLAANALYALEGPGDRWILALRSDAVQNVWECV